MRPLLSVFPVIIVIFAAAFNCASAKSNNGKAVVCYVATWAHYRVDHGKFELKDLRPELCTHLVYAFAGLDTSSWTIRSLDRWLDIDIGGSGMYKTMTSLRQAYPDLTVSLAIGGWNEGSKNYSSLVKFPERRKKFVDSVVKLLGQYGFNGFDLDWEFPGERGGDESDKENFVALVKELSDAFRGRRYHLSAAISANIQTIKNGYNIVELSKYLDYIHVMTYDYHTSWERKVLPNAPLRSADGSNVESTLKHLLKEGAPPNKLVMGVAFYGRTFELIESLESPNESPVGKACTQEGFQGPYTKQDGFMGYNEICEELVQNPNNWKTGWDDMGMVPYMINDKKVVIYDDLMSVTAKVNLANDLNLGGVMIWSIDTDDFRGKCAVLPSHSVGSTANFPLTRIIKSVFIKTVPEIPKQKTDGNNSAERFGFSYVILLIGLAVIYARERLV